MKTLIKYGFISSETTASETNENHLNIVYHWNFGIGDKFPGNRKCTTEPKCHSANLLIIEMIFAEMRSKRD